MTLELEPCHLGHAGSSFDWCPYCPSGEERRRRFLVAVLRALRRPRRRPPWWLEGDPE